MSISSEIARIGVNVENSYTAVNSKGGILPSVRNSANLPNAINSIQKAKPEQSKTVTPTAGGVTVTPDSGNVLSSVFVNGDADLVAGNVKSGVNIFGVTGTLQPAKTEQSKTLTLGAAAPATVTPDSGKVLSGVPVSIDSSVIKAENIAKDVVMLGITGTHEGGGGHGYTVKQLLYVESPFYFVFADGSVKLSFDIVGEGPEQAENVAGFLPSDFGTMNILADNDFLVVDYNSITVTESNRVQQPRRIVILTQDISFVPTY